jgi:hypothetical protein
MKVKNNTFSFNKEKIDCLHFHFIKQFLLLQLTYRITSKLQSDWPRWSSNRRVHDGTKHRVPPLWNSHALPFGSIGGFP